MVNNNDNLIYYGSYKDGNKLSQSNFYLFLSVISYVNLLNYLIKPDDKLAISV